MTRRIDDDAVKRRIRNIVEKWKYQGRKYDALLLESVIAQIVDTQPTLTPPNESLTCAGCYHLDKQCAPCAYCIRSAGYADYYRRPPEGEEDT